MALISPPDRDRLRQSFAGMTRPVRLLFFMQTFACGTCLRTRQILDELPVLSDKITIEEVNFVLERDKATQYAIDCVPAVAIVYEDEVTPAPGVVKDSRIRFLGMPAGYEFVSLAQAVLLVGGGASSLSDANRARVAAVDRAVTIRVFSTPTCPHCPRAVSLANEMAFVNPNITAYAVEVTEFPDMARRYMVNGVPKTVVNDEVEILGALPQDEFIEQVLAVPSHTDADLSR